MRNTLMWRLISFVASLIFHCTFVAVLLYFPGWFVRAEPPMRVRVYKVLDLKKEPLIFWAPDAAKLPTITSPTPIGDMQAFRGARHSATDKIVVAQISPEPTPSMVWQPDKPARLRSETSLPNLVAIQGEAPARHLAAPPVLSEKTSPQRPASSPIIPESAIVQLPTAKPKPKVLSWSKPSIQQADSIKDTPPDLALSPSAAPMEIGAAALGTMPKRPPVYRPGRNLNQGEKNGARTNAPSNLDEVPALAPAGTGSTVTAALIGLNPAQALTKLPDGSREAAFSRADLVGVPSAPKSAVGPAVPGVAVAGNSRPTVAPAAASRPLPIDSTKRVNEFIMPPTGAGMSAPLRPGARSLPRVIEARFRDRTVYTLVVPKPNQPQYISDWTVWFAERTSETLAASSMKAPTPLRKSMKTEDSTDNKSVAAQGWVQLSGIIGTDGKISSVVPLHGRYPIVAAHAAEDLMTWEFRPAVRNGVPVEVEVVIEVPFQIR